MVFSTADAAAVFLATSVGKKIELQVCFKTAGRETQFIFGLKSYKMHIFLTRETFLTPRKIVSFFSPSYTFILIFASFEN